MVGDQQKRKKKWYGVGVMHTKERRAPNHNYAAAPRGGARLVCFDQVALCLVACAAVRHHVYEPNS